MPIEPSYIHFLDSDDYLELDCVEECIKVVKDNPEVEIVWHGLKKIYEETKNFEDVTFPIKIGDNQLYSGIDIFKNLIYPSFSWSTMGIINFKLLKKYHLRFAIEIESEDALFGMQLFALAKQIFLLDKALYIYRIRPNSISQHTLQDKKAKNKVKFPTYLQDVVESFQTDYEVRHYSFAYSHCIICIEMDQFLQKYSQELDEEIKEILIRMIEHRAVFAFGGCGFVSDPRNCREMCKQIKQYSKLARWGSKLAFYMPWLYAWLKKGVNWVRG